MTIRITTRQGDNERSVEVDTYLPELTAPIQAEPPGPATAQPAAAPSSNLEWSETLCDGERVDHATAEAACAAHGPGWRLPTRVELESILDLTRHEPAIDTARFPDTQSGYYWTATPCAWSSGYAWLVDFNGGYVYDARRSGNDGFVRAVRGLSPPAS